MSKMKHVVKPPEAEYASFWRFEAFGEKMAVMVIPAAIRWTKVRAAIPMKTHTVDLLIFGSNKKIDVIKKLQDGLEDLTDVFMTDGGPIDEIDCINAETAPGAEAGYDRSRIHRTGEPYLGGIRLEFTDY